MSQSAFGPDPSTGKFYKSESAPAEVPAAQRDLLESVLRETLAAADDDAMTAADLAALQEVALRHPGAPFRAESIGMEMVAAVLKNDLQALALSESTWQAMATAIARTLCDDPVSCDRLAALWSRLSDSAQ